MNCLVHFFVQMLKAGSPPWLLKGPSPLPPVQALLASPRAIPGYKRAPPPSPKSQSCQPLHNRHNMRFLIVSALCLGKCQAYCGRLPYFPAMESPRHQLMGQRLVLPGPRCNTFLSLLQLWPLLEFPPSPTLTLRLPRPLLRSRLGSTTRSMPMEILPSRRAPTASSSSAWRSLRRRRRAL